MEYKMYLAIVLLSVGLVACNPVDLNQDLADELAKAVESMNYDYYNTGMWLNRFLTEEDRYSKWSVPSQVPQEEVTLVRALTAYMTDVFKSDTAYFWPHKARVTNPHTGGLMVMQMKEQWNHRFNQRILSRCQKIVDKVRDVVMKIRSRELAQKSPVDLKNYGRKAWPTVEQACEKVLSNPEHFMDLSYAVATENNMMPRENSGSVSV